MFNNEINMDLAIKFIILVGLTLLAYVLGYIFTETKLDLAKWRLFQFKAFECRPCLSFHICWVLTTFVSLIYMDWIMLIVGIAFAFVLFIGLNIDQKNKTINL